MSTTQSRKQRQIKTCPKCGKPYSYIEKRSIGNKLYIYAVHYTPTGQKRRCYLGSVYKEEYILSTLDMILREAEKNPETLRKVIDRIIRWLPHASKLI